jgi:hypothetical protein
LFFCLVFFCYLFNFSQFEISLPHRRLSQGPSPCCPSHL